MLIKINLDADGLFRIVLSKMPTKINSDADGQFRIVLSKMPIKINSDADGLFTIVLLQNANKNKFTREDPEPGYLKNFENSVYM